MYWRGSERLVKIFIPLSCVQSELRFFSQDVVAPKTTMEVKVFMQQSKDITAATAAECKDKFLIQSTPVPADWVSVVFLDSFAFATT